MHSNSSSIPLYWWEGFFGFENSFRRVLKRQSPYIKNFGDRLSPFIVSLLSGKHIKHSISSHKLLGLGSIFFSLRDGDIVWGSGLLNAKHISYATRCRNVKYLSVRGPETRSLLLANGLECPEIYGDPALLLPLLVENDIAKKYQIGIVPHFSQYMYFTNEIKNNDIKIINVEEPLSDVIRTILSCEIILSSSLHGLIVAEAYDIPALMVGIDPKPHAIFKFEDYFHSTKRSLSYKKFNFSTINEISELALKQDKLVFNTEGLLKTFPFEIQSPFSNKLSWSGIKYNRYRHQLIPPRVSVL